MLRSLFAADARVLRTSTSTVFRLRLSSDQGPHDIVARLCAKGLVMLSARQLPAQTQ